ncbi:AhpC/TSA family protein [Bacillus sp. 1780r2a1]|uniref:peroxiredoxin-like family protein n=1 Tax=Priestia sp. GS2 TaxID=3117403 RepID=UPI0021FB3E67|nr:AhpC/TSA family protein [Bacillus sp. 1780r2a1]
MSTLQEEIQDYKKVFKQKASKEKQEKMKQATEELEKSGIAQGLKVGNQAPDFTLLDATGQKVSFKNLLQKGPVIVTFYRGGWCPYCNLELKAYQRELTAIKEAGGELVAISPELPDSSLSTKEKNELEFIVLSDEGNKVAEEFNLVFKMPDYLIDLYKESGLDVSGHNGNNDWELPKPATFVVDQQGRVVFADVDSDYTKRTEPSKVIDVLKNL